MQELLMSEKIYNSVNKTSRDFEIFLNGKVIPLNSKVIGEKDDEIFLKDIVKNNAIVLRYSDLHCNICIDTMINNLINVSNDIGNENIILLITSQDTNYIPLLTKRKRVSFLIYKLTDELDKLFTDIDLPYYLMIEKSNTNMRINSVFVPLKENQHLTHRYLQNIIREYFR
ncbi:MAG: hypothetical protein FWD60_08625 [Candidatus Azobacteroides sp.]|nr:hypothetical protein [Candidatus Azobacteroides sp.]